MLYTIKPQLLELKWIKQFGFFIPLICQLHILKLSGLLPFTTRGHERLISSNTTPNICLGKILETLKILIPKSHQVSMLRFFPAAK